MNNGFDIHKQQSNCGIYLGQGVTCCHLFSSNI
jgi:hypothetical protein